jgi:nucleotide-binding universal stress UspA family protein
MTNTHKAFSATKILLPIDFSSMSEATLEAATGIAEQFHAGIHLVHIIPENPDFHGADFFSETSVLQEREQSLEERLNARKERLMLKGVPASFSIETDNDIVGALMRVIKREEVDMVVISTHGLTGWRPLIHGSIAEHLIKQVNCTLVLLQSGQHVSDAVQPAMEVRKDSFVPHDAEAGLVGASVSGSETRSQERLNRAAEEMAEGAGRAEQHYDKDHAIFTK